MRNVENKIILDRGDTLYRYDICTDLPNIWDTNYHNIEYAESKFGSKNSIGAIFLYDKIISAEQVLAGAINNQREKGRTIRYVTITSTTVNNEIVLLNLEQGINRCSQIISVLYNCGIDVATKDFINYHTGETFDLILSDVKDLYSPDICVKLNAANNIDKFFCNYPPYLGQLLSDYKNGVSFKQQLQNKGYEGYTFMEIFSSNTYCIFSQDKLSHPSHTTVDIENNEEIQKLIDSDLKGRSVRTHR